jgi:hypothetical protein
MFFEESPSVARHYLKPGKIAKTSKTAVAGIAYDNVIENFDFEKLARSNEVTGDFDVGLGWSRLPAYTAFGISGVIPHPDLCRT